MTFFAPKVRKSAEECCFPFLVAVVVVALVGALGLKFGTSVEESVQNA